MAAAITIVLVLSRLAAVDGRLAVLLAVGAAVCGNTAIMATAPVISARSRDVAYAVATVALFGTLAVFVYPLVGHTAGSATPSSGCGPGSRSTTRARSWPPAPPIHRAPSRSRPSSS
jgi:uncharacterized membrane protein YadS